jgi:hypothetical protein
MWPFQPAKEPSTGMSADPNEDVVTEIYRAYPYRTETFGLQAFIRTVVFTVLEMKKRGMI